MHLHLPLAILFTLVVYSTSAQLSFINRNDLLVTSDFHSGVAIGIADMDSDGKDDIVRMNQGYDLYIEYQRDNNSVFESKAVNVMGNDSRWAMSIGDIDNNGLSDVVALGHYDQVRFAIADDSGGSYLLYDAPNGESVFAQSTNLVDINNDGYLDLFVCHDDGESKIWGNNQDGTFSESDWIDMSIDGSSGEPASGNYGSVWTDFDNDGDLDLYIAKCRGGVTDPTDERRINKLYINDGAGNFMEAAQTYGLNIGWQSWTADFQDVNNDGHLDCFITNHDHPSQLMINDGTGHFTEAENTGIEVEGIPIQGIMRDLDNDGWVDILTTGSKGQVFINKGDLTFREATGIFDNNSMQSAAVGDLNDDGFIDIYGGYAAIFTNPTIIDDVLWMNQGNNNHYISIELSGVLSNRDAIGSRILLHGEWGIQVREVRAGEGYGISNSHQQTFGIGEASYIDSVEVFWPSGLRQVVYEPEVNTKLDIIEGDCVADAPEVTTSGPLSICTGESVTLSVKSTYISYLWSDGSTQPSIEITEPGVYFVVVKDGSGCLGTSESFTVEVDPPVDVTITAESSLVACEDQGIILSTNLLTGDVPFTWNNGETTQTIVAQTTGIYYVTASGLCDDYVSNEVEVTIVPTPESPFVTGDEIFEGETATLTAVGNNIAWYDSPESNIIIYEGSNYTTEPLTETTSYYVEDRVGEIGPLYSVGMEEHSGTPYTGVTDESSFIIFDTWAPFTLESVTVFTDTPGERRVVLESEFGDLIASRVIDIDVGTSRIQLDFEVPVGVNLMLGTDESMNLTNFGMESPRLQRSSSEVAYPYTIEGLVTIHNSNFGPQYYYYFYDWEVRPPSTICESARVEVVAEVKTDVSTSDGYLSGVKIYPNPMFNGFHIEIPATVSSETTLLSITSSDGSHVLSTILSDGHNYITTDTWSQGIYMIQLTSGDHVHVSKINKY